MRQPLLLRRALCASWNRLLKTGALIVYKEVSTVSFLNEFLEVADMSSTKCRQVNI